MQPKAKLALRVVVALFALLGVLVVLIVGITLYQDRQQAQQRASGTAMLQAIHGGTPTRLGLVIRETEKGLGGVIVHHYLVQALGQHSAGDGQHELLVYGYRELKVDIGAKIEAGEIDIAKLADSGTEDMLVDTEHASWSGSAAWMSRKDGQWTAEVCCKALFWRTAGSALPSPEFPALSAEAPTFKVDGDYFALIDRQFEQILSVDDQVNDLEDCLRYREGEPERQRVAEARAAARESAAAASKPGDDAEATDTDDEDMASTEPDFVCARASAKLSIKPQTSAGFHLLQLQLEGEGPSRQTLTASYEMSFEPKERRYGFRRVNGVLQTRPFWDDFLEKLNAAP